MNVKGGGVKEGQAGPSHVCRGVGVGGFIWCFFCVLLWVGVVVCRGGGHHPDADLKPGQPRRKGTLGPRSVNLPAKM